MLVDPGALLFVEGNYYRLNYRRRALAGLTAQLVEHL